MLVSVKALDLYNPHHDSRGRFTSKARAVSGGDRIGVNVAVSRGNVRFGDRDYKFPMGPMGTTAGYQFGHLKSKFVDLFKIQDPKMTMDEAEAFDEYLTTAGSFAIKAFQRGYAEERAMRGGLIARWLYDKDAIPQEFLDYLKEEWGTDDMISVIEHLDTHDIEEILRDHTPPKLKKLSDALIDVATRHKLPKDMALFRWASDPGLMEKIVQTPRSLVGGEFGDKGVMSTYYGGTDCGYTGEGPLIAILKRAGQSGFVTNNHDELEVLLPPQMLNIVGIGPIPFPSSFVPGVTGLARTENQVVYLEGGI